jgi:hypothetical protein
VFSGWWSACLDEAGLVMVRTDDGDEETLCGMFDGGGINADDEV